MCLQSAHSLKLILLHVNTRTITVLRVMCRSLFLTVAPNLDVSFDSTGSSYDADMRMYTLDMTVTWEQPIYPNGVVSYEVTVTQTDNSSVIVYSDDSLTVTSVTQSVMVLPYTNYTVTVTASTSAGEGDPKSIVELSPEAGK